MKLKTIGDLLTYLLPMAALYFTPCIPYQVRLIWLCTYASVMGFVYFLKLIFITTHWHIRPSGGSYSFPSASVASAFFGATWLAMSFTGITCIIVPYLLAIFVGYTRIYKLYEQDHWIKDVIVGAVIGIVGTYCLVELFIWVLV